MKMRKVSNKKKLRFEIASDFWIWKICNAPMIEWYHSISLSNKKIKADVIHRKNKTIFEVDAPPVGENWRGGVRKCACLAEDCSSSLFLSLPMPCNAIHYSSTTWTITFGGCRIDVFDLMFCCCHSFFLLEVLVDFHLYLLTYINNELLIMIDWLTPTTMA